MGDIGDIKKFEELITEYITREKVIFVIPGEIDDKKYPGLPIQFNNDHIISLSNLSMIELNNVKILLVHRFDISITKHLEFLAANWEIGFSVFNLFNRKNISHTKYVIDPADNNKAYSDDVYMLGITPTFHIRLSL